MILPLHPLSLHIIRHGEVEQRYHQVFGGSRIDMALSPLGHEQGGAIADWFQQRPLHRLYASPMLRVQQTITPLVRNSGTRPVLLPDLREIDFGAWTGLTWSQLRERFNISAYDWLRILESQGIPDGETAAGLLNRVRPCLQTVLDDSGPNESVAIACHGGIARALIALLLQLPISKMSHFAIDYGSITTLSIDPRKAHGCEIEGLNRQPMH
jgi:broad specificity phosphatase PhoE